MNWLSVFGRLHPLILHLPIGLLVALALLEVLALKHRAPLLAAAQPTLAWITAGTAVLSAATGYALSREGGYDQALLVNHLRLGMAVAAGSVGFALLRARDRRPWLARSLLVATLGALLPAGHLGATLTHGQGFLTAALDSQAHAGDGSTYARVIAPIFAARCGTCHGERKRKGGLELKDPQGITRGGEHGPVLVAGHPHESALLRRLRLAPAHDDHMPPKGKPQPTPAEVDAIEAWIAAGAAFEGTIAAVTLASAPPVPAAEPAALARLRERLVHVEPLTQDSPLLAIDFAAVAPAITDADVAQLLLPVRAQVAELALGRARATDTSLGLIAQMTNLRRLDLHATAITGTGLAALVLLPHLDELNLAQTSLGSAALDALLKMPALQRVFLWRTGLSSDDLARLRAARATLEVATGEEPDALVLESETEIKLTGDAPLPDQPRTANAADALKPVNSVCPVSGGPIDLQHVIVFRGRVIGFCCAKCPAEFWADPAKFESKLP